MSREKGCKFCIRHGLPLLPIRPGIMASDDIYPVLPAGLSTPLPAQGELAWTGRLLREGFLYIWAESAKRWINYFVTAEGYYYPLPEDGVVPSDIASGCVKPCISNPAELASASLITLPVKPLGMKNGLFWFCWSEVAWTMQVRRQHEEEACRSEVMQAFDMDAWLAGGKTTQAVSVDGLERTVAEFAPDASSGGIPLWSALSRKARGPDETEEEEEEEAKKLPWKKVKPGEGMYLRQAAEGLLAGKGAILLLQDPPAILQELSVIIEYELQNKVYGNPEYQRELALAGAIGSLEKGMREQYEHQIISQVEAKAQDNSAYAYNTKEKVWCEYPSLMRDYKKRIQIKNGQSMNSIMTRRR
ncbi:MAG: hypothetical protein XXXJIFNMEKO3_02717 [Candidatus Erwinia impunctatus]|nr:hypothetical protein XXXJIFNMEKO_02717 [Culicoides impunctatus]